MLTHYSARLLEQNVFHHTRMVGTLSADFTYRLLISGCSDATKLHGAYMVQLGSVGLWPARAESIQKYRDRASGMSNPPNGTCPNRHYVCRRGTEIKDFNLKAMDRVIDDIDGICLDCIRQEIFGETVKCRVNHPRRALNAKCRTWFT